MLVNAYVARRIFFNKGTLITGARRYYSSELGNFKNQTDKFETDLSASTTGVLTCDSKKEVILYYDHVYPFTKLRLIFGGLLRRLPVPTDLGKNEKLKSKLLDLSSTSATPLPEGTVIKEMSPLKRDGGVFVKFLVPSTSSSKEIVAIASSNVRENQRINDRHILKNLSNKIFSWYPMVYPVKGVPWIEDLKRYPSTRIKIIFEGASLTEEEIYAMFRRYGPILDINPSSATTPYAVIKFKKIRSAICAKNCVTGISLDSPKTVLHLRYIPIKTENYLSSVILNHQRISIPIILALLATVAVLVFDPIRQWCMEQKVSRRYSLDTYMDNELIKGIYSPIQGLLSWMSSGYDYIDEKISLKNCDNSQSTDENSSAEPEFLNSFLAERREKVKQLKLWIYENVNTYIIVRGPQGSGKQEFVLDNTLQSDDKLKRKVLYIDCDKLIKARSEKELLKVAAHQLGYFPLFTWTSSLSKLIDLGVQSLTGQKSGFSETTETQLKNIYQLSVQALRNVALSNYALYRREALRKLKKRSKEEKEHSDSAPLLHEDDIVKEDEFLQLRPELKPVIVINNYSLNKEDKNELVHKTLASWTSQLVQHNIAHVIFITHDVGSVQYLNEALPNQVFKTIALSDASEENAKEYVINQLKGLNYGGSIIDKYVRPLGGRMLDLKAYVRRIRSGETPENALNEMITQSAEQLTTFFLSANKNSENNWSAAQVWMLMKLLSEKDTVSYSELQKSPLFKSSAETATTLSILEKHDLIALTRSKGVLSSIAAGRPLFKEAFKNLVNDHEVFRVYETDLCYKLISLETMKIANFEDEVEKVSKLRDLDIVKTRLKYIQEKITASTENVKLYEERIKEINSNGTRKLSFGIF